MNNEAVIRNEINGPARFLKDKPAVEERSLEAAQVSSVETLSAKGVFWAVFGALWAFGITYGFVAYIVMHSL